MEKRGIPDDQTIEMISNENAKQYIKGLGNKEKLPLSEICPFNNEDAQDLIDKMLDLNPKTRITIEEAIKHQYLENLHDPDDEPIFEGEIDFSFENDPNLTLEDVKKLILQEISFYNQAYYDLL